MEGTLLITSFFDGEGGLTRGRLLVETLGVFGREVLVVDDIGGGFGFNNVFFLNSACIFHNPFSCPESSLLFVVTLLPTLVCCLVAILFCRSFNLVVKDTVELGPEPTELGPEPIPGPTELGPELKGEEADNWEATLCARGW